MTDNLISGIFYFSLLGVLLLIPAAVPVYLIYKLTKSVDEKKKQYINMYSIAFFIPFCNLCLFILPENYLDLWTTSAFWGFGWLFIILPISFLICIFTPAKIFKYKKFVISTIVSTFIFGWIMVILALPLRMKVINLQKAIGKIGLKQYQSTIDYIEKYKQEYGKYPKTISNQQNIVFNFYEYKTYNADKDFQLKIAAKNSIESFSYCSNENLIDCSTSSPLKNHNYYYYKVGKWVAKRLYTD